MTPQAISMLGTIGINAANALSQHFTNQHNERLVGIQNRMNIEQWYRENAYNDPSAVMARLRRAGLNPALFYGNGAETTAATSPMLQASKDIAPQMTGESIANLQLLQSQVDLNKANARLREVEAEKTGVEINWLNGQIKVGESVVIHNNAMTDLTQSQKAKMEAETKLLANKLKESDENIKLIQSQTALLDEQKKLAVIDQSLKSETTKKIQAETGFIEKQAELYQKLVMAQISNLNSETILNKAKGELTAEQIKEVEQQTNLLKVQGDQISYENTLNEKYGDAERSVRLAQTTSQVYQNYADVCKTFNEPDGNIRRGASKEVDKLNKNNKSRKL